MRRSSRCDSGEEVRGHDLGQIEPGRSLQAAPGGDPVDLQDLQGARAISKQIDSGAVRTYRVRRRHGEALELLVARNRLAARTLRDVAHPGRSVTDHGGHGDAADDQDPEVPPALVTATGLRIALQIPDATAP